MYPLQISLHANGGLHSIDNAETINKKWTEDILPQLKTYYQSETTDQIFEKLSNAFKHLAQKKNLIQRNIFTTYSYCPFIKILTYMTFIVKKNRIFLHKYSEEYFDKSNHDKIIPSKTLTTKNFGKIEFDKVSLELLKK